jgi:serine/threonine protein kinase
MRAELSVLSRLQHRHLVKLLGWCKNQGTLYVVSELIPGVSAHQLAFADNGVLTPYPWKRRFQTIKDIASALRYLHEGWEYPIIHRNVKLNNVIIESKQNHCKLGDYGLNFLIARSQIEHAQESADLCKQTKYGYFAPEYVETKVGTIYTDVYSFGVLCLEIACRRPLEDNSKDPKEQLLVEWLLQLEDKDKLVEAIEEKLLQESELKQIIMVLGLGLMCFDIIPKGRPTMKEIERFLSGETPFPPTPIPIQIDTVVSTPNDLSLSGDVVLSNMNYATIAV